MLVTDCNTEKLQLLLVWHYNIVTAKGSAEKKTEKIAKRKKRLPAGKKQATISDDSEEICSADTCLRPAGQ